MTNSNGARFLRTGAAAKLLQVSDTTINRWTREGKLPYMRTLGGWHLYPEAELRALAEEMTATLKAAE